MLSKHTPILSKACAAMLLGATTFGSVNAYADIVAAVLPTSRSVEVGSTATAFATVINSGTEAATGCGISTDNASVTLSYNTTNSNNEVVGAADDPATIAAGGSQSYVFSVTAAAEVTPTDLVLTFDCDNTEPAPSVVGLNTLLFSASTTAPIDIIAIGATPSADGVIQTAESTAGAFAIATFNVGVAGDVTVAPSYTGSESVSMTICETNSGTGACLADPADSVVTSVAATGANTYSVFVASDSAIALDPANKRVVVSFTDTGGAVRGSTSVAMEITEPSNVPLVYEYTSAFDGESSVSYSGQTARQVLIEKLTDAMVGLTERPGEASLIDQELSFYITGEGADAVPHNFTVSGGETVTPGPTYGDISTGKNLDGKIAGGDGVGGGETSRLINGEFFGWEDGLDSTPLPIELVSLFIDRMATEASDGTTPSIAVVGNPTVSIGTVTVDAMGVDYRQLTQKFLLGAVNLSQGTTDYFGTDFANALGQEGTSNYTAGEHDFDEAYGYYGGARNMNDYTDDEAAAKGGRPEFANGYNDANGDGSIDIRSEYVFGHAQNCAKRDRGSAGAANPTDFSKTTFDAFLAGRQILQEAAVAQSLSQAELDALNGFIETAAKTWEACIAATVIHYINDTTSDMGNYQAPVFADLDNFLDVTKHWAEMKGFALSLQFNPFSPFRDGSVQDIDLDSLKQVLALMGDAPVLADGSQGGENPTGTAQEAIDAYLLSLRAARDILQLAYGFDSEVVEGW